MHIHIRYIFVAFTQTFLVLFQGMFTMRDLLRVLHDHAVQNVLIRDIVQGRNSPGGESCLWIDYHLQ